MIPEVLILIELVLVPPATNVIGERRLFALKY